MEHATTVLIADSAEDFCTALTAALQRGSGFQVVGTAGDGEQAIRMIADSGACGARMTGSGSAVFGVYDSEEACARAHAKLLEHYPTCRMMKTEESGVVVEEIP